MVGRIGWLCLAGLWFCAAPLFAAVPQNDTLKRELARVAPELAPEALRHALAAMQCAVNHGAAPASRLAVIDYSLPSTERRLWIFDLEHKSLLLRDFVAHGRASGENMAERFSNRLGSNQTSLGLFRTAESYRGKHGYSLRMDGLDPGVNDLARARAIVIHGADYVSPLLVQSQGRIGRSLGCPAVRQEVARLVVDQLKGGQYLFAWHSDPRWTRNSAYLTCEPQQMAALHGRSEG